MQRTSFPILVLSMLRCYPMESNQTSTDKNKQFIEPTSQQLNYDPNAVNGRGESRLHVAAHKGDTEMCSTLLKDGALVNALNKDRLMPLHRAAQGNHSKICLKLIQNGAQIDAPGKMGWTALHIAAQMGYVETCLALLKKGAHANALEEGGYTPFLLAAQHGREEASLVLLQNGADVPNSWSRNISRASTHDKLISVREFLITHAFLTEREACKEDIAHTESEPPSGEERLSKPNTAYWRSLTIILCLRRKRLSRNLAILVLTKLADDVFQCVKPHLLRQIAEDKCLFTLKRDTPTLFHEIIIEKIYQSTLKEINNTLPLYRPSARLEEQFKPEKLELNFGKTIKENIRVRLGL